MQASSFAQDARSAHEPNPTIQADKVKLQADHVQSKTDHQKLAADGAKLKADKQFGNYSAFPGQQNW